MTRPWSRAANAADGRRDRAGQHRGAEERREHGRRAAREIGERDAGRGSTSRPRCASSESSASDSAATVLGSRNASSAVALKRKGGRTAMPHTAQRASAPARPAPGAEESARRRGARRRARPAAPWPARPEGAFDRRRRRTPADPALALEPCAAPRSRRPPPERRATPAAEPTPSATRSASSALRQPSAPCTISSTRRRRYSRAARAAGDVVRAPAPDRPRAARARGRGRRARPCRGPTRATGGKGHGQELQRQEQRDGRQDRPRQEPAIGGLSRARAALRLTGPYAPALPPT